MAKAPQSFYFKDVFCCYQKEQLRGFHRFVDSASLVASQGIETFTLIGPNSNIKITTQEDLAFAQTLLKERDYD